MSHSRSPPPSRTCEWSSHPFIHSSFLSFFPSSHCTTSEVLTMQNPPLFSPVAMHVMQLPSQTVWAWEHVDRRPRSDQSRCCTARAPSRLCRLAIRRTATLPSCGGDRLCKSTSRHHPVAFPPRFHQDVGVKCLRWLGSLMAPSAPRVGELMAPNQAFSPPSPTNPRLPILLFIVVSSCRGSCNGNGRLILLLVLTARILSPGP